MPGRLPGMFFKIVVSSMLDNVDAVLFPQVRRRIADMQSDVMYSWDDYTDMMQTVSAKLPRRTLVEIGRNLITQSRADYDRRGFSTAESILKDWAALFNAFIHGAPARDLVRTESFQPGRVVLVAGVVQPEAIVEGYLRGVIESYTTSTVTSVETMPVVIGGANYNRIVMTWE